MHGREARAEIAVVRDFEKLLGGGERFLRAHDALLDRRVAAQECARDLVHAESAQDVEDQRDLRFFPQPRMTAGEHHAELPIFDHARPE